MRKQTVVFLHKELLTQALLDIVPVLVDSVILLSSLRIRSLHLLILSEELLELVGIEASCLTVHEGSREKHLVRTLVEHVLHLVVGDGKTELVTLFLDELVLHEILPYLITKLVELIIGQVLLPHDFHSVLSLIHELGKVLVADFLS